MTHPAGCARDPGSDRWTSPARGRPTPHARGALVSGLLLLDTALVAAGVRPSALLFDATLSDARDFTVNAAEARGWVVHSVTPTHATFEQILDANERRGTLVVQRLLRVSAEFVEESAGARVYLQATEIEWPDTEQRWSSDVTARYADNLANALSSLQGKWDAGRTPPKGAADREETAAVTGAPAITGTWSYYAEHYAQGCGCDLGEQGARLIEVGQDWEHYRVSCRDGTQLHIRCRYGDCTTGP